MSETIVEMQAIEKSFSLNKVLHSVDFCLKKGSIHALLGENGTGKTTLMNILGGVIHCDGGQICISSQPIHISDTTVARENGIAFIHQELTLINDLTIYENLFLGQELKRGPALDIKAMCEKSREVLSSMEIDLDPKTLVEDLNASYKQVVEIARSLLKNAKVIIMDEPTTSLTDVEIKHVFEIMRSLKKQGVSIVFISHKLREVIEICDSYTVMRDGKVVSSGAIDSSITEHVLARHMVGKELSHDDLYRPREVGEIVLEVKNLSSGNEFRNANFQVRKGEIVGFTGLLGDGRSELLSTVYGCKSQYHGEIFMNGKLHKINKTTVAHRLGISYVPRNRKENGILKDLNVSENMTISILNKLKVFGMINKKKQSRFNAENVKRFNIKTTSTLNLITSLSGGNQQKVVLAKSLASNPQMVILDNPTQGVDIGAKLEIYAIIMKLAEQGVSFVVLSSEAQEILMLCDRTYVMYHGEIRKEFSRQEVDEEKIMIIATGGEL